MTSILRSYYPGAHKLSPAQPTVLPHAFSSRMDSFQAPPPPMLGALQYHLGCVSYVAPPEVGVILILHVVVSYFSPRPGTVTFAAWNSIHFKPLFNLLIRGVLENIH